MKHGVWVILGLLILLSGCVPQTPPPHYSPIDEEVTVYGIGNVVDDSAILYYTMDESSLPLVDIVNYLNLTYGTFSTDTFSIINNSAYFNAFSDDYVTMYDVEDLKVSNPFISFWHTFDSGGASTIISFSNTLPPGIVARGFIIGETPTGQVTVLSTDDTFFKEIVTSNVVLDDGEWHHICAYFNGDWNLFVNNVSNITYNSNTTTYISYNNVSNLTIGYDGSDTFFPYLASNIDGFLDEFYYGNISSSNASDACHFLYEQGLDEKKYPFVEPGTPVVDYGNPKQGAQPYLYNDSEYIYFNESKLNSTVDDLIGNAINLSGVSDGNYSCYIYNSLGECMIGGNSSCNIIFSPNQSSRNEVCD